MESIRQKDLDTRKYIFIYKQGDQSRKDNHRLDERRQILNNAHKPLVILVDAHQENSKQGQSSGNYQKKSIITK